jgi:hypothetical protein
MSLKLVAVQGMTVLVDQTTAGIPNPSPPPDTIPSPFPVVASIAVAPPTSLYVKCEGKLVHRDDDKITVTAITVPGAGATIPDPGPYTVDLNATAQYVKAEGKLVLRVDDQSDTVNATPQIPGSPPTDYPVSFKCVITVAGQTKVKAQ